MKIIGPYEYVKKYPLGVDVYEGQDTIDWSEMVAAGKVFAIARATYGTGHDGQFGVNWPGMKAAGLIRGSYCWVKPGPLLPQVNRLLAELPRLLPGDMPPAFDFEDAGFFDLPVADVLQTARSWLALVESALGRQPIMYTGRLWTEHIENGNAGSVIVLSDYPLWTAHPNPHDRTQGKVFGGWTKWTIWQYGEDAVIDSNHTFEYHETGVTKGGTDFNAFNGTIWQLRGFADCGRPACLGTSTAWSDDAGKLIVYSAAGGTWVKYVVNDLVTLPRLTGDPNGSAAGDSHYVTLLGADGAAYLIYNQGNDAVWTVDDLSLLLAGQRPLTAPSLCVANGRIEAAVWTADDHIQWLEWSGQWTSADVTALSGAPNAASDPHIYVTGGTPHIVHRSVNDGFVWDIWYENGAWQSLNLSEKAPVPAATYRLTSFTAADGATVIVYRTVGGALWTLRRDTLEGVNISNASIAPTAIGGPTAFALGSKQYVVFRDVDGHIQAITIDGTTVRCDDTGGMIAASDPVSRVSVGVAAVVYLGADGTLSELTFDGVAWTARTIESLTP